jgi:hypothetical protein
MDEVERQLGAARARMPHLAELAESERPILDALAEGEKPLKSYHYDDGERRLDVAVHSHGVTLLDYNHGRERARIVLPVETWQELVADGSQENERV